MLNTRTLFVCWFFLLYFLSAEYIPLTGPEEIRYISIALNMSDNHQYFVPLLGNVPFFDKPILYYWLIIFSVKCFGWHNWVYRLPNLLLGLGAGFLLSYFSPHFFHLSEKKERMVLPILFITSPLVFLGAHFANMDIEIAVLISASVLFLAFPKNTPQLYLGYILMGLGFLCKGLIAVVFPVGIIGLWILCRWQWREVWALKPIQGLALTALVIAPWFLWMQHLYPSFFYYFFYIQQVQRFLEPIYRNASPVWFYLPVLALGLLPWSLAIFLKKDPLATHSIGKNQLLLWIWALVITLFFSIPRSKTVGYILPVIFPLSILLTQKLLSTRFFSIQRFWLIALLTLSLNTVIVVFLSVMPQSSLKSHQAMILKNQSLFSSSTAIVVDEDNFMDVPLLLHRPVYYWYHWQPNKQFTDNWAGWMQWGLPLAPQAQRWYLNTEQLNQLIQHTPAIFFFVKTSHQYLLTEVMKNPHQMIEIQANNALIAFHTEKRHFVVAQ